MRDGCEVESLETIHRGNSDNPIDIAEVLVKFKDNTREHSPVDRMERIIETVDRLETMFKLAKLAALFVVG